MNRQQRRGAQGDGELSNAAWIEKERLESAEPPVAPRHVGRPTTSAPQDDQLMLEQEMLRDHRAYTTGATAPRGPDGQVQPREQESPHVRVSVGQTSGAAQRCRILDSAPELAIRNPQAQLLENGGEFVLKFLRSLSFVSQFGLERKSASPLAIV
jgi:hypothetical protein